MARGGIQFPAGSLACLLLFLLLPAACGGGSAGVTLTPDGRTLADDLPRYGLNLGGSGTWGAEQLRANVLANPGFEAIADRSIMIVKHAEGRRLVDDTDWLARPTGFWTGGRYDVRSGAAAGGSGRILDSRRRSDGLAEISIDAPLAGIAAGDVVVLSRDADLTPAPGWWIGKGRIAPAGGDPRPGSPGRQSVRLLATGEAPAELLHYFDNISDRGGKLLPVRGAWRLQFWARSPGSDARLKVRFDRGGHAVFVDSEIAPGPQWQHFTFDFEGRDDGPPGVLTLGLTASGGEVRIDDASLAETAAGTGGFRRQVVDTLRTLRPGFLRDWQGQLGDTLDNRLAPEHGHRPVRYRPGEHETQFHYSLPDFLELCAAVGAQPWVVAPTTLDDSEWRGLGSFLREAADRHRFQTILVEFGNENWNAIFRPAGIPSAAAHAAVADRGFALLKAGAAGDRRLVAVANAQFVNPDSPKQIATLSKEAQRIAVAPYFLYRLDAGTSQAQAREMAFSEGGSLLHEESAIAEQFGKRLSAYEENFHTTLGTAPSELRNLAVTNAAGGAALARRLLQGTLAGLHEQAVYSFAGLDSYVQDGKGLVRLWGITRDLAEADRLRPTGLALALLNSIAGGPARKVGCSGARCAAVTAVAFGPSAMAIVSASPEAVPVTISGACSGTAQTVDILDGSLLEANNEKDIGVRPRRELVACDRRSFLLPPFSLAVVGAR